MYDNVTLFAMIRREDARPGANADATGLRWAGTIAIDGILVHSTVPMFHSREDALREAQAFIEMARRNPKR